MIEYQSQLKLERKLLRSCGGFAGAAGKLPRLFLHAHVMLHPRVYGGVQVRINGWSHKVLPLRTDVIIWFWCGQDTRSC